MSKYYAGFDVEIFVNCGYSMDEMYVFRWMINMAFNNPDPYIWDKYSCEFANKEVHRDNKSNMFYIKELVDGELRSYYWFPIAEIIKSLNELQCASRTVARMLNHLAGKTKKPRLSMTPLSKLRYMSSEGSRGFYYFNQECIAFLEGKTD